MKKLFENWNNYLNERANPSESRFREAVVDFIVGQMKTMGMNPGEPKDRARIQKETHNIVDLAIEQLGLAQERASLNEGSVPHSAHHVVKKMMKTGKSAKETLKSLTTNLSDEEAERWLKRHKDEMDSAKQDLKSQNEAMYEPGRAVADIDTGEERMSPNDLDGESVQDLADKFGVKASIEQASDGKDVIIVRHKRGDVTVHNDSDEMYQELAKRSSMKEDMGSEILIPGYGSLTVRQARRKLAKLIMAAAEDAQKDPPAFRYLDDGVIQAIHQALKDNNEQ